MQQDNDYLRHCRKWICQNAEARCHAVFCKSMQVHQVKTHILPACQTHLHYNKPQCIPFMLTCLHYWNTHKACTCIMHVASAWVYDPNHMGSRQIPRLCTYSLQDQVHVGLDRVIHWSLLYSWWPLSIEATLPNVAKTFCHCYYEMYQFTSPSRQREPTLNVAKIWWQMRLALLEGDYSTS